LHQTHGLTDNDWEVVQVKKAMMDASAKTVLLTISEKINTAQRIRICDTKDIDVLITELELTSPVLSPFKNMGIEIL
jgi:DeoR/GlpR family transcriptional regulator of sugar metabolism